MCGIVGILGTAPVAGQIVDALKRLEYRGYDSAGVATLDEGRLARRRAAGKLRNLENELAATPLRGEIGIGHTRWATHGRPNETNAHPHATERLAVVHNGIIENFRELREALAAKGRVFVTETDSEVVAHLVTDLMENGLPPVEAVAAALPRLKGAFALAFLFAHEGNLLIGARRGAPLAIGHGQGEMFLGSDALALAPFTDEITYLEDGDWAVLTRAGAEVRDETDRPVRRPRHKTAASALLVDKGNYRHFMAKEIHEQAEVLGRTLAHYIDPAARTVKLPFQLPLDLAKLDRITILACGTAYMAALTVKYWFERFCGLPVEVDVASEFRYRETPMRAGGLTIVVSQSGETADTLASLRYAKANGQRVVGVVNVPTSTMARECDVLAQTMAGPEIGVASTKAFTCQLVALACLAVGLGRTLGSLDRTREEALVDELMALPGLVVEATKHEHRIEGIARALSHAQHALYLGRGTSYPLALEGALKLKELSYIHAEGYAAGELKHGPIALVDEDMPVIVLAPPDAVFDKTVSNLQEVAARGGRIILIGDAHAAEAASVNVEAEIPMAPMGPTFTAVVYAIPIQLLAYHVAVVLGKDADQPRNLAKSVTVE